MARIRIRKNKEGKITSYQIRVYKGKDQNGKELKPYIKTVKPFPETWSDSKIEKELNKIAVLFEKECNEGNISNNRQNFASYADYVISLKSRSGVKRKTIELYKKLLERINPAIGHFKLTDIKPHHLNLLYEQLAQKGLNKRNGGYLSEKTIVEHHRLIHTILTQAEKELIIPYNAASKATPPKIKHKEANFLEVDTINLILKYLPFEPLKWQVIMSLLIFTGSRRGEILALTEDCIDIKNNQIIINKSLLYSKEIGIFEDSLKTESSKRVVAIPNEVILLIKQLIKENKKNKLKLGSYWNDNKYIFRQENGNPMHPDSITNYCNQFQKKYNKILEEEYLKNKKIKKQFIPHLTPHAFRHSQASILIEHGEDILTVSKRLGHSRVSTTSDIYSHLLDKADRHSADLLSDIFLNKS